MAKMHELLAVETAVAASFNRELEDTTKKFGKGDLYSRTVTKKEHFSEEDQKLDTVVTSEITTTVKDSLDWFAGPAGKFFDFVLTKDKTNQKSNADIVLDDGTILATSVPATTLLMLESKLQEVRRVFEAAPTLAPGITWEVDPNANLFRSKEPKVSFSTKKNTKPVVLYAATDKHPAQVKEVSEDLAIARITQEAWSGMITSAQKAEMLGRLDELLQATKKARQRANVTEVVKGEIGKTVFSYLLQGK
jgi:hypothetical protein